MAHPVISSLVAVTILLAAAAPTVSMHLGQGGISTLPANTESRRAFEILNDEFAGGVLSPMKVVVDGDVNQPQVQAGVAELTAALTSDGMFSRPTVETSSAGDLVVVSAAVTADPDSGAAHDALGRVRNQYVPAAFDGTTVHAYVTGQTAQGQDMLGVMTQYMPIVFAFVLGLSFLLLLVLFRSIVVPAKAIIMNLLSVGAAYGLLVLVFQHGVGADIFGFQKTETIESWLPLFLFAVLFGLSMDYHVFLLSRIKERFDRTGDNAGAVAYGMRSTSGIITGAALIMVTVFSGFAMGSLSSMQQMGFGLAVAAILDATIIRCVLVPASMELLGDRNWYLPSWLSWLRRFRSRARTPAGMPNLQELLWQRNKLNVKGGGEGARLPLFSYNLNPEAILPEQLNLVREEDGLAQDAFRVLLREGRPLSATELGEQLGVDAASVTHILKALQTGGRAEIDDEGRLLGVFGLTLKPTQHHLDLRGIHFFTWCAFDSVGIPAALRESAEIVSECAHCQREIHLTIVDGSSPSAPVVISWRPRQCDSVQEEFCPTVNFFCDEGHFKASSAYAESDGNFLSLDEASALGGNIWAWAAERT